MQRKSSIALIGLVFFALTLPAAGGVEAQSIAGTPCQIASGAEPNADALDRWVGEVWNQGRVELVATLLAPSYLRHETKGSRTVSPSEYRAEIESARRAMPDVRFVVHDCAAIADRVWMRWTMVGTSKESGTSIRRMGAQVYRLSDGRIAETWMLTYPTDAAWPEAGQHPSSTSP